MGLWADLVLPKVIDRQLRRPEVDAARRVVCSGLHGSVVEIGFGSGLNVPHYPRAVTEVIAVEPSNRAWHLARERVGAARVPVLRGSYDGQRLDQPDATADTVLTTFSLCTIPDVARALGEARRVLRPGGTIHFLEHGASPDPSVAKWQRRVEPVWKRIAGGCHLTRPIASAIADAGFKLDWVEHMYVPKTPRIAGWNEWGAAVAA